VPFMTLRECKLSEVYQVRGGVCGKRRHDNVDVHYYQVQGPRGAADIERKPATDGYVLCTAQGRSVPRFKLAVPTPIRALDAIPPIVTPPGRAGS